MKRPLAHTSRYFRYIRRLTGFLTGLMLLTVSGCDNRTTDTQLDTIVKRGKLRVGTLFGTTSYYIDKEGSAGFEYELAKAFADHLNLELEIIPNYQVSELFTMLDNQQVDFLAGGLSSTEQRRKKYRFSPGYLEVSQKLVFKQGNKRPRNFDQLNGTLLVTAQSSHAESLTRHKEKYPQLSWEETGEVDPEELLEKVVQGEVDYTIADSNSLAIYRRYYPNLSIAFTINKSQSIAWMLSKQNDDSLYSLLIEFFGLIHQNGQLTELVDKYFGHVEKFNYSDTKMFIKATETRLPKYKAMFVQYAQELDWRLLAALSYQESLWKPKAKSHTGVRGLMMMTRPTAKQMGVTNRLDPEQNIRGGSKYLRRLLKRVPERIPFPDRLWFAVASYNIGWGHVEDARVLTQRHGGDPDKWIDVKKRLPLLKQRKYYKKSRYGYARGDEPVRYVANIRRYYHSLVWLDEKQLAIDKDTDYQEKLEDSLQQQPVNAVESTIISEETEVIVPELPEIEIEK
ncbi:MAG: membrane-bound lytic murein transglycosylase F [Phenylobacterium sp.]|jgi:membrane-bound lytic murein transglycosylase F